MSLDFNNIPTHLAIILDGNGRWAKKRLMPRNVGHRKGAYNLRDITNECNTLGVRYLTVYCFSTENWKRPEKEVNYLMQTPIKYYKKYREAILDSSIRIKVIGRRDRFSKELLEVIEDVEKETDQHTGITLTLCIDYGSYEEMTTAIKQIAQDYKDNKIALNDINQDLVSNYLYTKGYPALDLLIRTSGECRISNYLLWQLAYSELYFTDVLWPDFNKDELYKAFIDYQSRNRRFGGLKEDESK